MQASICSVADWTAEEFLAPPAPDLDKDDLEEEAE
jgi:hypothetical protein